MQTVSYGKLRTNEAVEATASIGGSDTADDVLDFLKKWVAARLDDSDYVREEEGRLTEIRSKIAQEKGNLLALQDKLKRAEVLLNQSEDYDEEIPF